MEEKINYISKKTKRGIVLLIGICIGIAFWPRISNYLFPNEEVEISFTENEKIKNLQKSYVQKKEKEVKVSYTQVVYKRPNKKFNPNEYKVDDWVKLGLTSKQAKAIINFGKGKLRSNADLNRIYALPEKLFLLIKDSTIFTTLEVANQKEINPISQKKDIIKIEINSADYEQLLSVKGIGKYYAENIIDLRKKAGGIYQFSDFLQLYGMNEVKLESLKKFVFIDSLKMSKLNINKLNTKSLMGNGFIDFKVANSIVKMRELKKDGYKNLEELKESELIDEELFQKLKPYLSL
jgi:competence protein ComEA